MLEGVSVMNSYFQGARAERYKELVKREDVDGIRQMKFGEILYNARRLRSPSFSQGRAAECAGLTRIQWNRIENGHVRPLPSSIPGIADALAIPPAILFRLAGHEVPQEFVFRDRKYAHKRLDDALDDSSNEEEFLLYMMLVWEEEQLHLMATTSQLPEKISFTAAKAELLDKLLKYLPIPERVLLAVELVESSERHTVEEKAGDLARFYEEIGAKLREHCEDWLKPEVEKDFIL
jgi:transcriptional regulator with XRE-family HTH domain